MCNPLPPPQRKPYILRIYVDNMAKEAKKIKERRSRDDKD
jgi:hypothetical protein